MESNTTIRAIVDLQKTIRVIKEEWNALGMSRATHAGSHHNNWACPKVPALLGFVQVLDEEKAVTKLSMTMMVNEKTRMRRMTLATLTKMIQRHYSRYQRHAGNTSLKSTFSKRMEIASHRK